MGEHIVMAGSAAAGSMTANRLQRGYDERHFRITVVDEDDDGAVVDHHGRARTGSRAGTLPVLPASRAGWPPRPGRSHGASEK
jgi:hypothetical protein